VLEPDVEVSLVLPAYNEQANIAAVLAESVRALEALGRPWEVLVIDNHSADDTAGVVARFARAEPRVRLIRHERNRLYAGSCRTGMREARGRYVAIMDSDGQFTAADLPRFLSRLEGGANLVFGWRRRRRDPLGRKLVSWVFNALGRLWLGFPLHDLNVGLRMFDRRFLAVAEVRHALNMANPELYVRARRAGLVLGEVEVRHFERRGGKTSHDLRRLVALFCNVNRYFRALRAELRSPEGGRSVARRSAAAGHCSPPLRGGCRDGVAGYIAPDRR
jgi:dolichol-phosphate mannosyltransferase